MHTLISKTQPPPLLHAPLLSSWVQSQVSCWLQRWSLHAALSSMTTYWQDRGKKKTKKQNQIKTSFKKESRSGAMPESKRGETGAVCFTWATALWMIRERSIIDKASAIWWAARSHSMRRSGRWVGGWVGEWIWMVSSSQRWKPLQHTNVSCCRCWCMTRSQLVIGCDESVCVSLNQLLQGLEYSSRRRDCITLLNVIN